MVYINNPYCPRFLSLFIALFISFEWLWNPAIGHFGVTLRLFFKTSLLSKYENESDFRLAFLCPNLYLYMYISCAFSSTWKCRVLQSFYTRKWAVVDGKFPRAFRREYHLSPQFSLSFDAKNTGEFSVTKRTRANFLIKSHPQWFDFFYKGSLRIYKVTKVSYFYVRLLNKAKNLNEGKLEFNYSLWR